MIRQSRLIRADFPLAFLFKIASDVEAYPQFLPGCIAARIKSKEEDHWLVENVYRFGVMNQKFLTIAHFEENKSIDILSHPSERIKLHILWEFEEVTAQQSEVHFEIGLENQFPFFEKMISKAIAKNAHAVEEAFLKRAQDLAPVS